MEQDVAAPVEAAVVPVEVAADPELEVARAALAAPEKTGTGGLLLIGSLVLFAAAALPNRTVTDVFLLIAVLFLHESGHWLGMRAFGYSDVKMFFIPMFGAAVSGRDSTAVAWKEGIVLLLGPLPGILLSLPVLVVSMVTGNKLLADFGGLLLLINAFNLLPISPLDGGRFFQLTLFARHRILEGGFLVCAAIAFIGGAIALKDYVFGVLGGLMLLGLGRQLRMISESTRLRASHPGLLQSAGTLNDDEVRALYRSAVIFAPPTDNQAPARLATAMRDLHDRIRRRPPGWGITIALGSGYLAAWLAVLVGVYLYVSSPALPPPAAPPATTGVAP